MISSHFWISVLFCINYILCYKNVFSIPNVLENNHDLKLLKNIIIENGGVYEFKGVNNTSEKITLKQITDIELENKKIFSTRGFKSTVKNFFLFTREYNNESVPEILDPQNITSIIGSHFRNRKTYIIIHGFLGNGLEPWILDLKNKLLTKSDSNVISVDWPAGYRWFLPTYLFAVGNVPHVGNDTAFLIENLIKHKGLLLSNIHVIGHSLGAHISGFSAKPFGGKVGKISGLDPAGPYFHNLNSSDRLDKKDAIFVDVIHTNACNDRLYWMNCFGLNENIGHSNFFPNGGEHQPACEGKKKKGLRGAIGCDHEMAYMYYYYSLDFPEDSTYFLARPCDDWERYVDGNCSCGKKAQYMGFNVNTEVDGLFYLRTISKPPFGIQDPKCPVGGRLKSDRSLRLVIICGYIFVAALVGICFLSTMYVLVDNVRRTFCSTEEEEEESLVSSDTSSSISSSTVGDDENCLRGLTMEVEHGEERSLQERPYVVVT